MNVADWNILAPSRPLAPGDRRYVPRPWAGGEQLARLVASGLNPIAVSGHRGTGKTTEMNRAWAALSADERFLCVPMHVDAFGAPEEIDVARVVYGVGAAIIQWVTSDELFMAPPQSLVQDLRASDPRFGRGSGKQRRPLDITLACLFEVRRGLGRDKLVFFVDGADHLPADKARAVVDGLLQLREDAIFVVPLSPELVNGPSAIEVLDGMHVFWIPHAPVLEEEGFPWAEARAWLGEIAASRLGLAEVPDGLRAAFERAAAWSGGEPRRFLQLLVDASVQATLNAHDLPDVGDVDAAAAYATDNLRRILVAGDAAALRDMHGTDGLEAPPDRKIRFLQHALMLEYRKGRHATVRVHPLLQEVVGAVTPATPAAPAARARSAAPRSSRKVR